MAKKVLVVGAGVVGLSAAYYAAKRGFEVTVVERGGVNRDGCSFGNAGLVVPSHFVPLAAPGMVAMALKWMLQPASPFYIKPRLDLDLFKWGMRFWRASTPEHVRRSAPLLRDLNMGSRACFEELATSPGNDFELVTKGLLGFCKTEHWFEEEASVAKQAKELGMSAEILDAKQTAALEPNLKMDIVGAIYFPLDCHLTPSRLMTGLKQRLDGLRVRFLWDTEATGWRCNGTRIDSLRTGRGELTADEYVLCGGSWSPRMVRDLGLRIPIQPGKGYSLTLPTPPRLPAISALLTEARIAVTPMGSSLRFGGTMEIAGFNQDINPIRVQTIIQSVPKYYPEFGGKDFEGVKPWSGLRPCSPDGLPYVGRSSRFSNLAIAAGHAMMGLSLGPITGKLIAEILSGEKPSIDLAMLNPDRYG